MSPNPARLVDVLIKKGNLDTETHTEHHAKMKAETGVMLLEAKESQGLPENHQLAGERQRRDSPSKPQEEPTLQTL